MSVEFENQLGSSFIDFSHGFAFTPHEVRGVKLLLSFDLRTARQVNGPAVLRWRCIAFDCGVMEFFEQTRNKFLEIHYISMR